MKYRIGEKMFVEQLEDTTGKRYELTLAFGSGVDGVVARAAKSKRGVAKALKGCLKIKVIK